MMIMSSKQPPINITFKLSDTARKFITTRGKGSANININTDGLKMAAIAKQGLPVDDLENYYLIEDNGIKLYLHSTVYKFAEAVECQLVYESGFLYTGLVVKGLIDPVKRTRTKAS